MKQFLLIILTFTLTFNVIAQPTTNAPQPPARQVSDVISIYSDVYDDISDINYNPFWGQSGMVDIAFNLGTADSILAYTNFNYQGTGFEANPQNASAMEYIHIDIWTSNATNVKFSPIDNSGSGAGEFLVEVPIVTGQWSSVDLPKSAFQGMTWNSIFQLKFDGQGGVSPSDIYLDNIYFWKSPTASGTDATLSTLQVNGMDLPSFTPSATEYSFGIPGGSAIPEITLAIPTDPSASVTSITQATTIPGSATVLVTAANGINTATYTIQFFYNSPVDAAPDPKYADVISLFSDVYTNVNVDTWNTSWSQASYENITLQNNPTHKYTNVGFNGIETSTSPINASQMQYLHMDIWTPNVNPINIKLVSFLGDGFEGANGDSEANLNIELIPYEWNQVKIPLSDFTNAGLTSLDDLNQYIFTSTPFGSGILYIDNVFFSSGVSAAENYQNQSYPVFPNPVTENQTVTVQNANITSMSLYNLKGELVKTSTGNQILLNDLSKGMYILKFVDDNNRVLAKKILVQ
ncbi:MAG: T9SS type A sorting domain-containing protein [Saprospiraceae bacterium]